MTYYPPVDEVVAVQTQLIARFGGSLGIRDRGAIESALARPRSGYYDDIIQEAAGIWESRSQNHPFVDGNKRVTKVDALLQRFQDLNVWRRAGERTPPTKSRSHYLCYSKKLGLRENLHIPRLPFYHRTNDGIWEIEGTSPAPNPARKQESAEIRTPEIPNWRRLSRPDL